MRPAPLGIILWRAARQSKNNENNRKSKNNMNAGLKGRIYIIFTFLTDFYVYGPRKSKKSKNNINPAPRLCNYSLAEGPQK